jgi:hypothetical protein
MDRAPAASLRDARAPDPMVDVGDDVCQYKKRLAASSACKDLSLHLLNNSVSSTTQTSVDTSTNTITNINVTMKYVCDRAKRRPNAVATKPP